MSLCGCICCVHSVKERQYGVLERFGKFIGIAEPGLNVFCWPLTKMAGKVNTQLQQQKLTMEVKTKDNVFVILHISVQFLVESTSVADAFYSMKSPSIQMASFVEDAIRAIIPTYELDKLFISKEEICASVKDALSKKMNEYGYSIVNTLITDITPEAGVKAAMNKINESMRLREAAQYQAETNKIIRIKEAEGEAEYKRLQGKGVAEQRKAIITGLHEGVEQMAKATGITSQETLNYTMMTQYFDTLREIGMSTNTSTLFIPNNPGIGQELMNSMMAASKAIQTPHQIEMNKND